jgi:hypothetical protein
MDDRFVAVLSLDFIHHKKYLLWMNTTDLNCQAIRQMMLKLCHYWKRSTLEPMFSCCCGCAITGKGQLSNQWLAVVVAVQLLERVNS